MDKQVPRPPRRQESLRKIRVQNRRREYLERHPEYFIDADHEFADPLLYQSLVRDFQTREEREADGKQKGYSRMLEGDLVRGEAKLQSLSEPGPGGSQTANDGKADYVWGRVDDKWSAKDKEGGGQIWTEFLRERFIKGGDEDFDYGPVDDNEDLDALERNEAQDAWFEDEDPGWAATDESSSGQRNLECETGIQDF